MAGKELSQTSDSGIENLKNQLQTEIAKQHAQLEKQENEISFFRALFNGLLGIHGDEYVDIPYWTENLHNFWQLGVDDLFYAILQLYNRVFRKNDSNVGNDSNNEGATQQTLSKNDQDNPLIDDSSICECDKDSHIVFTNCSIFSKEIPIEVEDESNIISP